MALPCQNCPGVRFPVALAALVLQNAHVNRLRADDREERRETAWKAVCQTDRWDALKNGDNQEEDVCQFEFRIEHIPQIQKQPIAGRISRRLDAVRSVLGIL